MFKCLASLALLCFLTITPVLCRVYPKEGAQLNYRLVGFSFPAGKAHGPYTLEIALGNFNTEDSFSNNIIKELHADTNRVIGELPAFDRQYTWRVAYTGQKKVYSPLYHFATAYSKSTDTTMRRLRITEKAKKYEGAYVFLDGNKVLYDMQGKPVWFLPDIDSMDMQQTDIRDMRLSPLGTITLLAPSKIFEINYDGKILWRGPGNTYAGTPGNRYHHEFKRLSNGHYIAEGAEITDVVLQKVSGAESGAFLFADPAAPGTDKSAMRLKILLGTLMEYDAQGKLVWSYNASRHFIGSTFWMNIEEGGMPDLDIHDNGFCFDEAKKEIYLSFRDISQVVKIKYPEGTTIKTYGNVYNAGQPRDNNSLFCRQHCPRVSLNGGLYMFNNNACHPDRPPGIVMLRQPQADGEKAEKVWEFDCKQDNVKMTFGSDFVSGGSVEELPDGSILADMGTYYSKVFIVNMDKEVLWSGMAEQMDEQTKEWKILPQYRASMIADPKKLEELIWNSEKD